MSESHGVWQSLLPQSDQLGESPFWHPGEQLLYWVDIPARQLRRAAVDAGSVESWAMPMEPGCIAPARSGGLVIALRDGIYRARRWGGPLDLIERFGHDVATTRFNDGKADPLGRLWAGTMYEPRDAKKAELHSIDCRPANGHCGAPLVERKAGDATIANGLAWSPDTRTVYWADTPAHVIRAWDWEPESNAMQRPRVFHQFALKPAGWQAGQAERAGQGVQAGQSEPGHYGGRPDGAAVDSEGNYWCAMFEGGCLLKLSAAGELLERIALPVRCPTMPCFGGPDLKTMFVTSASHGRSADELEALPLSGQVLWRRTGVAGLPVNFFLD